MSNKIFYLYIIVFMCLIATANVATAEYIPDELIVTFAIKADGKQMATAERSNILAAIEGVTIKDCSKEVPGMTLVKLSAGRTVEDAMKIYSETDGITHVQPNFIYRSLATSPNDPYFGDQWGLYNYGQEINETGGTYEDCDIDAPEAWDVNTVCTNDIIVAVIDTGIDYTHPDLEDNMWNGNQYHGHDFANDDPDPRDDNYHGTHVAGIIGAVGDNGIGISGVAWKVKIMAIKALDSNGSGNTYGLIPAVKYADRMGAKVINA